MATRKFLLVAGQSNAAPVGDFPSWEDKNIAVSIRSPRNPASLIPQYSEGSYDDVVELPTTFAGGPQSGFLGDGPKLGSWQNINCRGKSISKIRMLTFYNPVPTYLNLGTLSTTKFPMVGAIAGGPESISFASTSTVLSTSVRWQFDPSGVQITRRSTGSVHTAQSLRSETIASVNDVSDTLTMSADTDFEVGDQVQLRGGTVDGLETDALYVVASVSSADVTLNDLSDALVDITTTTLTGTPTLVIANPTHSLKIDPPFIPQPVPGEEFTYTLRGSLASSSTNEVIVEPQFGGLSDLGTVLEPALRCTFGAVLDSDDTARPLRVSLRSRPAYVGQAVTLTQNAGLERVTSVDVGTDTLTLASGDTFKDGDLVEYDATAGTIPGLSAGSPYRVYAASGSTIKLRRANNHSPLDITGAVTGLPVIKFYDIGGASHPAELDASQVYYVTRLANEAQDIAFTNWNASTNELASFPLQRHGLVENERVRLSGSLPPRFAEDTDYYVYVVDGSTAKLMSSPSGDFVSPDPVTGVAIDTTNDWVTLGAGHQFLDGDRVRFTSSGTYPSDTTNGTWTSTTTFFVVSATATTVQLSMSDGGAAVDIDGVGSGGIDISYYGPGGNSTVHRQEDWSHFFISTTPGGDEVAIDGRPAGTPSPIGNLNITLNNTFRGTLTGMRLRAETGGNTGQVVPLGDVDYQFFSVAGSSAAYSRIELGDDFTSTPQAGDTYTILPPQINNRDIPFGQWGMFLPWTPFEGEASGTVYSPVLVSSPLGAEVAVAPVTANVGDVIRIYSDGDLPTPLKTGNRYYVHTVAGGTAFLSETHDGDAIIGDGSTGSGDHVYSTLHQEGKSNPFPPGFNYPNHYDVPNQYQPFFGVSLQQNWPQISVAPKLALLLSDDLGEQLDVVSLGIGGTNIAHQEVVLSGLEGARGYGWYDLKQQQSWAPGEDNGCFARLLDIIETTKNVYAHAGDTGECVGIVWPQGESDAFREEFADEYEQNARRIRTAMRQAVKDAGLFSGAAEDIPFVHPKVRNPEIVFEGETRDTWLYGDTVNAAIAKLCDEDPVARTVETEDLPVMADLVHYTGAGMDTFAGRCYEALVALRRDTSAIVNICNLALAHIGESTPVTSIQPPDDTEVARLCAKFYPVARNSLLETQNWTFAIKRATNLTSVPSAVPDQWQYAYRLPANATGVVEVLVPDTPLDSRLPQSEMRQHFDTELDSNDDLLLYTNTENPVVRYKTKVVDPAKFSEQFKLALSWHLGSLLAGPIIKGDRGAEQARMCLSMARDTLGKAQEHDGKRMRRRPPEHIPNWIRKR